MDLSDEQRRWLGTAVAMAKADGLLKLDERKLIDEVGGQLGLSPRGRLEVEAMLFTPPTSAQLAAWAIGALDRLGLYRMARRMATADSMTDDREASLLRCLAAVLRLTPEEVAQAEQDGQG